MIKSSKMSSSQTKKKEKLDLSKLTARELLLIGESQTFSQPCSSKTLKDGGSHSTSGYISGEDSEDSDKQDTTDSGEDSGSGSEDDWEEVDDRHVEKELQKYDHQSGENSTAEYSQLSQIPENGLEIVIPKEGVFRKGKKKVSIADILRSEMNRERRDIQEYLHKVSFVCQLARGLQLNEAIGSSILRDVLRERIKGQTFSAKRLDLAKIEKFMKWFRVNMIIEKPSMIAQLEASRKQLQDDEFIAYQIMEKTAVDSNYYVMIFAAFLRHLNVDVRLVISVNCIPLKPPSDEILRKPRSEESDEDKKSTKKSSSKRKGKKSKSPKKREVKVKLPAPKTKTSSSKNTGRKMISSSENEDEEISTKKDIKRKSIEATFGQDMWVEIYLIEEERWISVDVLKGKVICDKQLEVEATQPLTYVLGFDNKNKIKDVTRRYASHWLIVTQKLRVKSDWLDETLKPYRGKRSARDREEDEYLDQHLLSLPIPKSMSEIKGHPLFVLRRHLLKYEALYPDNPKSIGFIKNEPIYSRDNVYNLHTRELWMREAKVVRIGEKPYKVVKGRPKYDKLSGARLPEVPSELFGEWQTEDFIPPIAQDGKVPRNEWGNVELFTEKLLPQGCVHLKLPGLQRVAKKLDIDCAAAVVGFDFGCGGSRPAFDGFVVCEEFKDTLIDAWNQDQDERKKKEEEKRLLRIYGNWRKLVRGVLIRDRLEKKYSVNLSGKRKMPEKEPVPTSSKKVRKNTRN